MYTRYLLIISLCCLTACYTPEKLPGRFVSQYQLALPIVSDTFEMESFNLQITPPTGIIPAGTILQGELSNYPFYLGNFSAEGQVIEWLDPKFLVSDNLPEGVFVQIDCFVLENGNIPFYFSIPQNTEIPSQATIQSQAPFVLEPGVISDATLNRIKHAEKVYFNLRLRISKDTPLTAFLNPTKVIRLKLGVKLQMLSSTNL